MKKVIIANELTGQKYSGRFVDVDEMNSWISEQVDNNTWGKAQREVSSDEGLPERVIAIREISEEHAGETVVSTLYTIKADYTIEIVDLDQDPAFLLQQCYEQRRAAYPPIADFVDAKVKQSSSDPAIAAEGVAQEEQYLVACLAVKTAFPKPE